MGLRCQPLSVSHVHCDQTSKTEAIEADDLEDYLAETPLHLQMFGERQRSTRIRRLGATTNIPGLSGIEFSPLNESPVMPSVHQN